MNRNEKTMPIILFLVLLCLIIELAYTIFNYLDYENRVDYGNARWEQVEERIQRVEENCNCGRYS